MYQFEKIKLVIWDLDDTFWKGTLSEEGVQISEENRNLIINLTDIGVVNSICSKNDMTPVQNLLEKEGLWEYFVFPSVNWEAKGNRVKQMIADMRLRPANVLFIDDNHSNREEVRYFCPDIMVEDPEIISQMLEDVKQNNKKDTEHKRLKQYKILEQKDREKSQYVSNEEFLMQSDVRLQILSECDGQIERIHDLLQRSNQLNFTKVRSTKEELKTLFDDPETECGYVIVSDRFGDYGIVGFYALRNRHLVHFTFSCRTLGMGIEQYIYNYLDRPDLEIVGEVISDLSVTELPKWINQNEKYTTSEKMQIEGLKNHMVLVKGPCDLFQIYPYIENTELFDTEFTYTTDKGITIETTAHTSHIVESLRLSDAQKEVVYEEVPFADRGMYNDDIFKNSYKVVFISILQDANIGVYKRKETGEKVAFLEYIRPITDRENWKYYLSGEYDSRGVKFTEESLQGFFEKYEFIGRNTPEQIVENLQYIREHIAKDCMLVIMLGGELYYEKNELEAYKDRHIVHKHINDAVRNFAANTNNVRLIDVNKYLIDQSSFYDHFNHYIKPVYYAMAKEMVDIVNECTGSNITETSKWKMVQIQLKETLAPVYYKIRKVFKKKHE